MNNTGIAALHTDYVIVKLSWRNWYVIVSLSDSFLQLWLKAHWLKQRNKQLCWPLKILLFTTKRESLNFNFKWLLMKLKNPSKKQRSPWKNQRRPTLNVLNWAKNTRRLLIKLNFWIRPRHVSKLLLCFCYISGEGLKWTVSGQGSQGVYTFTNFRVRPGPFVQILYDIVHTKHRGSHWIFQHPSENRHPS